MEMSSMLHAVGESDGMDFARMFEFVRRIIT